MNATKLAVAQRLASCRAGKHLFKSDEPYECLYCLTRGDALSAMSAHTSGPWQVGEVRFAGHAQLVTAGDHGYVCEVAAPCVGEALDETARAANARLIAAAPELLDALEAVMAGQIGGKPDLQAERFQNARAALAKARGQ